MATSDTRPTQDADAGLADELEREFARAMASQEYDPAAVIGGPRPVVDAPDAVERVAAALAKADGYKWFSAADEGQYFLKRSQDIYRKRARAALAALPVQPGERSQIVAWLRENAEPLSVNGDKRHILSGVALAIERGDFLKGTDDAQ